MTKEYLRLIDTNTGGNRYDVTPLFADHEAFIQLLDDLVEDCGELKIDAIAAIDALGFILGAGLAQKMEKGLIPIRKGGKLPVQTHSVQFKDYSGMQKSLELRRGAFLPGTSLLIVDEWIETGSQVMAAIELIENIGGKVVGIASINIDENEKTRTLREKYKCVSVWAD